MTFTLCVALATSGGAQTQTAMNAGAGQDFLQADHKLNEVYQAISKKISPAGRSALQEAERTWVKFRDQECTFETMGSVDGSIHPMLVAGCKTDLTQQRSKGLEKLLTCQEGDVACGGQ